MTHADLDEQASIGQSKDSGERIGLHRKQMVRDAS
jgi:hypothetical protein